MAQEHDKMSSLLFSDEQGELGNFKLLRTAGEAVPAQFVREQLHSAMFQAWKAKTAETRADFRRSDATPVDIAGMVATL